MRTSFTRPLAAGFALLALLGASALAGAAPQRATLPESEVTLTWAWLGAGGGRASSASYLLDAALGQPLTGAGAGPTAQLSAGYWQVDGVYRAYLPRVSR